MKFISPTWDNIYTQSIKLAGNLRKSRFYPFDAIVGVSRGGLPLTRILSDLLGVSRVMITRCEYYSDVAKRRKKPIITQEIQGRINGEKILLVDDVADTGESLLEIKKYILSRKPKNLIVATLYIKPWSKVTPDFYVAETDAWIIFPWELYESIQSISKKGGMSILKRTGIPKKYIKSLLDLNNDSSKKSM